MRHQRSEYCCLPICICDICERKWFWNSASTTSRGKSRSVSRFVGRLLLPAYLLPTQFIYRVKETSRTIFVSFHSVSLFPSVCVCVCLCWVSIIFCYSTTPTEIIRISLQLVCVRMMSFIGSKLQTFLLARQMHTCLLQFTYSMHVTRLTYSMHCWLTLLVCL